METAEKMGLDKKKKFIQRSGMMVAIGLVFAFIVSIGTAYLVDVQEISMHVSIFTALMFLYPIMFFLLGMAVVMKKKIVPMKKQ